MTNLLNCLFSLPIKICLFFKRSIPHSKNLLWFKNSSKMAFFPSISTSLHFKTFNRHSMFNIIFNKGRFCNDVVCPQLGGWLSSNPGGFTKVTRLLTTHLIIMHVYKSYSTPLYYKQQTFTMCLMMMIKWPRAYYMERKEYYVMISWWWFNRMPLVVHPKLDCPPLLPS